MSKQVITLTICDPHEFEHGVEKEARQEIFLIEGHVKYMDVCDECAGRPHIELAALADKIGVSEPPNIPGVHVVPPSGSGNGTSKSSSGGSPRKAPCPVKGCDNLAAGEADEIYSRGVKAHVRQNHDKEWQHYQKHGSWSTDESKGKKTATG
jgi:hypothetical protein